MIEPPETSLLNEFFKGSQYPLVVISALAKEDQEAVAQFSTKNESSNLHRSRVRSKEDPRLEHLQIRVESAVWQLSSSSKYPIDGILRIGGIPVTRLWRDLEDRAHQLAQCSLSDVPFSGLSWGHHIQCHLNQFLPSFEIPTDWHCRDSSTWVNEDKILLERIHHLFSAYPSSEPALYHALSNKVSENSMVYLGNSLPVREWDMAASYLQKNIKVTTSRGLNGIDGQLSTFLGECLPGRENWVILGDLTMLYDFPAMWILHSLPKMSVRIVVVNNGGGKLFSRIYKDPVFQHLHDFDFEHFAKSWRIPYLCLKGIAILRIFLSKYLLSYVLIRQKQKAFGRPMMLSCKKPLYNLYALHGFLGLSHDWSPFPYINYPQELTHEELPFWEWASWFNQNVSSWSEKRNKKNILLGYSLGGRLAMHLLISKPELWDGAIIISAHPGLSSELEKEQRVAQDHEWAVRFKNDPWIR